jgi:hypothetical protein
MGNNVGVSGTQTLEIIRIDNDYFHEEGGLTNNNNERKKQKH